MIKTKRGLDLPITGAPGDTIDSSKTVRTVATQGYDYPGLKPTMAVSAGDRVKIGQVIYEDKKNPGVLYTAPASGLVSAINRGAKRVFQSLVIDVEGDEHESFPSYSADQLTGLDRQVVAENLIQSGEWTALRTRPFSKVPAPGSSPEAIFVTAMDTRPLAPDPTIFIGEQKEAFLAGLDVMSRLTDGKVFVCKAPSAEIPASNNAAVQVEEFAGPHPAGLVGTHIHFLRPASEDHMVWHIGYQDLIAVGHLFLDGRIFTERLIAMAGPCVDSPRLVRTRVGACSDELTAGELSSGENRVISGSVLDGRKAEGALAFLGRFHNQISVLKEGRERELFQFLMPGIEKFSLARLFIGSILPGKQFNFTTSTGGSERAMVPIGSYESVMPLDILPTQLLRALLVEDLDSAQALGALELDEEDLALCTFACPGKYEYGPMLRELLERVAAEG